MSRFGKKLTMVGIWAGIGVLIGMQFGGSGGKASAVLPGWYGSSVVAPSGSSAGGQSAPDGGTIQGGKNFVYVPMAVDPVTGAYTAVPVQTQSGAASAQESLPQQEVPDYSTKTPEQILIPEEQKPTVDVLADKTAGLLQQASQKSIRWVVSLFDSAEE